MRKVYACVSALLVPVFCLSAVQAAPREGSLSPAGGLQPQRTGQQLYFLENKGQVKDQRGQRRGDVDFCVAAENGLNIFIGKGSIHYQWSNIPATTSSGPGRSAAEAAFRYRSAGDGGSIGTYRMDMMLEGADRQARAVAEKPLAYYERYYLPGAAGATAHAWQRIVYRDVYPNIDWVLYIRDGRLEYDFVVRPGGRAADIRLRYDGAVSLQINADGSLTAATPMGSVTEQAPVSFAGGGAVASRFTLKDHILGFETGAYEGTLTIDPVLEWATYYGGTGSDYGRCVAVDNAGAVYMTGSVLSAGTGLATSGAHQGSYGGPASGVTYGDAYLVKFDSAGNRLWATYFGGTASEGGWGVACDEHNNVYLTGQTASAAGIAGGNSFQGTYGGGQSDAFLAKFDASGAFQWATYYGGTGKDEGWGVACDQNGYVYLTGTTASTSAISSGSNVHQPALNGAQDGFLVKFDLAGNRQWATYFGGSGTDLPWTAKCDNSGNVYISGETGSPNNMATPGVHQTVMTPSNGSEAFLEKFDPAGTRLWGTYYGGDQPSQTFGTGIAVDDSNAVYMSGYTTSTVDIATPGSHQPAPVTNYTSYLVKFDSTGSRLWGTYYGGSILENGYGAACDPWGNVYITGYTSSPDNISTAGAPQFTGGGSGNNDFYVAKFNRNGVRQWGTYYGGSGYDAGISIAANRYGSVYVAGFAQSGNIGTQNAYQPLSGGGFDGFLFRLSECTAVGAPAAISGPDSLCSGASAMYGVAGVPGAASYSWTLPSGWLGNSYSDSILVTAGAASGSVTIVANGTCNSSEPISKTIGVYPEPNIMITVDGIVLGTADQYDSYQWYMNNLEITGATDSSYRVIENGEYSVRITDAHGCSYLSDPYRVTNVSVPAADGADRNISVYPNPAQDVVYIRSATPVQAVIKSVDGRVIARHRQVKTINISSLAEGMYFLQLTDEEGRTLLVERLVKAGR